MVRQALRYGADVYARVNGKTMMELAQGFDEQFGQPTCGKYPKIVEELKAHMAELVKQNKYIGMWIILFLVFRAA